MYACWFNSYELSEDIIGKTLKQGAENAHFSTRLPPINFKDVWSVYPSSLKLLDGIAEPYILMYGICETLVIPANFSGTAVNELFGILLPSLSRKRGRRRIKAAFWNSVSNLVEPQEKVDDQIMAVSIYLPNSASCIRFIEEVMYIKLSKFLACTHDGMI